MIRFIFPFLICAQTVAADAPRVLTDIAPIQSLTARVMNGIGAPDVILAPGADPHHYSLTVTSAFQISEADVTVWVGPALTPWLAEPLATLATDATHLALAETHNWGTLELRDTGHDAHGNDGTHDHGVDPHGWLDPAVAGAWMVQIADTLASYDPENAETYRINAEQAALEMAALSNEIAQTVDGLGGRNFILPHDGYQYFETRFALPASGFITNSDAHTPGPARIAHLREQVLAGDIVCVFTDRETDASWAELLVEGTDARTVQLDAGWGELPTGARRYPEMLRSMARAFVTCLE
jgi:zinc transport system substrate-binding protein